MWMTKRALDALELRHAAEVARLTTLNDAQRQELTEERMKVVMLERAMASSQSNLDWMRIFANQLSHDRDQIARLRGFELAGPTFEGGLQTPADVEARAVAAARAREAGGGAPAIVGATLAAATDVDSAMAAYTGHVGGFEDVGDEEAERLGISHHEQDGAVEYVKR